MGSDRARQLKEMIEDHLGRNYDKDAGLIAFIIADALALVQNDSGNWAAVLERLRAGLRDTRAAIEHTRDDGSLARLRTFAERQVAFAALLEQEIISLQADETTRSGR